MQPEATVANGATVTAGQLLFHVGNSGNSSEPHLHVHIVDGSNTSQPMKFARGQTTPFTNNIASLNGPWIGLKGNALPMAKILIWPPHPIGNWTYNGIDGPAYQRVFEHFVDSGVMADTVTCKNSGDSYDTTWIPAKGAWASHHGMSHPELCGEQHAILQAGVQSDVGLQLRGDRCGLAEALSGCRHVLLVFDGQSNYTITSERRSP